jgi:hypothetical protein
MTRCRVINAGRHREWRTTIVHVEDMAVVKRIRTGRWSKGYRARLAID